MTFAVGAGKTLELVEVDDAETTVLRMLLVLVVVPVLVGIRVKVVVESDELEAAFEEIVVAEGRVVCALARAARASAAVVKRVSSIAVISNRSKKRRERDKK